MEDTDQRLNREALFCDGMEEYRFPEEPDEGDMVRLRFRTAREDADSVWYIDIKTDERTEMEISDSDELFDYYETEKQVGKEKIHFYFEIIKGNEVCKYNRLGVTEDIQEWNSFEIIPGFHVPEWAKGAIMYQIYVDRFCNGDQSNDVVDREYYYITDQVRQVKNWDEMPRAMDVGDFYGGDLQGILDKLDYLKRLRVQVIYLNPVFVSPSNHKYDCQDYEHIDPHYGVIVKDQGETLPEGCTSNAQSSKYASRVASKENLEASDKLFAKLVEEAHKRGMKVILDGVFNHCGSFNKWMDREQIYSQSEGYEPGAYRSADSPYRTFFKFLDEEAWPDNGTYDGWWGHDTLPKLNYEDSPKLREYIMRIAKRWVSPPFDVDGWRLDVAADLGYTSEFNHTFWQHFRKAVKEAKPEALILAEHYGDPSSWLKGNEWDTVMNYDAFMEPVSWFLTGMEKHSDEIDDIKYGNGDAFFASMAYHMCKMQPMSILSAMNQLDNHDHSRFLTRTNRRVGRLATAGTAAASEGISYAVYREAVMIQMTWPGAPTIYYGDETGICGWTDPDNRRTYPWGHEDLELIEFYCYMTGLHEGNTALRIGSVKPLLAGKHLIAYGRFCSINQCVIVVNNSDEEMYVEIPVWPIGITDGTVMTRKMLTYESGYNAGAVGYTVEGGKLSLHINGKNSALFTTWVHE